jgi:hypothetical protein
MLAAGLGGPSGLAAVVVRLAGFTPGAWGPAVRAGDEVAGIAWAMGISRQAIMRARDILGA